MKRYIIALALLSTAPQSILAQDEIGMSFSFLFPQNSKFSTPISPLSIRGLGIKFGESVSISTGFTAYRMAESTISNLEFASDAPLLGPSVSFVIPFEMVLKFKLDKKFSIKANGGVFLFNNAGDAVNDGNLSSALADHYEYTLAQTNFEYQDKWGWGYQFGIQPIYFVTSQVGIAIKGNYYLGEADLDLSGTIQGWSDNEGYMEREASYKGNLDFKGFELSLGVIYKNK
ncbi:MAG TPA: hypothetical protein EYN51_10390 [Flavobacteriales bacterium]|nr:hypothetical protein [Flavobacteriales bacterium]HIA13032.1 hypothetical protein [Flavobacteriales bacterium]HIO68818.1 hypothetical protein [Flavobacteriales bacterium]